MLLYRITGNNKGIYSAIKEYLNEDEWHKFQKSDSTNWLPNPGEEIYENNDCITLFTEEGYRKFLDTVAPIIRGHINMIVKVYEDTEEDMLYSDRYQKIFRR